MEISKPRKKKVQLLFLFKSANLWADFDPVMYFLNESA